MLDIVHNINLARTFVAGLDAEQFVADVRTVYAVTRCLEIISEAVRKLPDEIANRHPNVPWSKIKAAGNIYRHEYDDVAPRMLWVTVETALHELHEAATRELREFEGPKP